MEVHQSEGSHTASSEMTDGREGRPDAVEEEGEEREEVGLEGGMERGGHHLQDLQTIHHCLSSCSQLIRHLCR